KPGHKTDTSERHVRRLATWRWDLDDQLPNGKRAGQELLGALRAGPPWPALDVVMDRTRVPQFRDQRCARTSGGSVRSRVSGHHTNSAGRSNSHGPVFAKTP